MARPVAVRPPRPRLGPSGEDVAPSTESVRCMRVTRRRTPCGTRRTSAGESKALPPWTAKYKLRSAGVEVADAEEDLEVEVEVEINC